MSSGRVKKSGKKSPLLATKNFSLIIGIIVIAVFLVITPDFFLFKRIEVRVQDFFFFLRLNREQQQVESGATLVESSLKINPDILILGIDDRSLSTFGAWPFPRYRHADLLNTLYRIQDQNTRERSILLDIFFFEPSSDPVTDAQLLEAISKNGNVFLETALNADEPLYESDRTEQDARQNYLIEQKGSITNISGDWTEAILFNGYSGPLMPYATDLAGYGAATIIADDDGTLRRQPLIMRSTQRIGAYELEYFIENYKSILSIENGQFQRIGWYGNTSERIQYSYPVYSDSGEILIDDSDIAEIADLLRQTAPFDRYDSNGDGEDDASEFEIFYYQDYFQPYTSFALAIDYLNIPLDSVEVVLGEYIRLPNPMIYNPETREMEKYRIPTKLAVFDENGAEISPAEYKEMDEIRIPIDETGSMVINFVGQRSSASPGEHQTFPVRPYSGYAQRATGPVIDTWPRTMGLGGKIILTGAFSTGMADDEKNTGVGRMYGIEIIANVLNTILMDNFLIEMNPLYQILLLAAMVLLVSLITGRSNTFVALFVTLVAILALFIGAGIAFNSEGILVNTIHPTFALVFTFLSIVIYRGLTEEREKRRVQGMFGQYVSPEVVDEMVNAAAPPELGGVDKELTVFFSDIRGFTTLSEKMQPQELVNHLNIYLSAMTDIIMEYKGTLDKYVGDEIMCFWGAPLEQKNHAILACQSALKQMKKLEELNSQWPADRRIDIGIGINSGIMTVGNMGSTGRMNYTLMGDNVNLGARLEGINKQYFGQEWTENGKKFLGQGSKIIISEYTYGLVKDLVVARELDNIRVKGKNKPVVIYELIDVLVGMDPYLETQ